MAELAWGKDVDPFSDLQSAGPWDNFPPSITTWEPSQTQFSPIKPGSGLCSVGVGMAAPSSGL